MMQKKIIWMYWHQGWDAAPDLAKQCTDSWVAKNPGYEVRLLDQASASEFVSLPEEIQRLSGMLTLQKYSNLIRLALLSRHGGAWADASVYCSRPLDEWLGDYFDARFFAFRNPTRDRLIANWFLAADPENVILRRLSEALTGYFARNDFSNQKTARGRRLVAFFNRCWSTDYRRTGVWFSWFARRVLRVYPYFIFHYAFNRLVLTDPECAALWKKARPFPARPELALKFLEHSDAGLAEARRVIAARRAPMFKLNWRVDPADSFWPSVLGMLREGDHRR